MKEYTMPSISYRITFCRKDGGAREEQWHTDARAAWEAFRLFAKPDSFEMYCRVELTEVNFEEHQDYPLAALEFPA
jgi:hypothetical protein